MKRLIILALLSITLIPCQAKKNKISLNLEEGKEYKQFTVSTSIIAQNADGQEFNSTMTTSGSMVYFVKAVHNSSYEMDVKYERLSMLMQAPNETIEFSSDSPKEDDVFSVILSAMINKPFQIKITKKGKVLEVNNIEAIFETAFDKFPDISDIDKEQLKSQLMTAYGYEAMKGSIEAVTAIYPQNSVREGDKWINNTSQQSIMPMNMVNTYELIEIASDFFLIKGESIIESIDKEVVDEIDSLITRFDFTGTMISDVKIDKESGWIIDAKLVQNIKGDMYVKEKSSDEMKIGMDLENNISYSDKY